MKRRDQLSDHFAKGRLTFSSKKASFAEVFPTIASIDVKAEIDYPDLQGHRLTDKANFDASNLPGQFIDCPNPRCSAGGSPIGQLLSDMVSKKQTHRKADTRCLGHQGGSRSRRGCSPCNTHFDYRIDIVYK
jgi:hypothetical protein